MRKKFASYFFLVLVAIFSLSAQAKVAYTLSLIHVNDTHSKFEPSLTKLTFDIDKTLKAKPVYLELGGFPYVAEVISELRHSEPNPLVIHAGDFFQGTLYFTRYGGEADVAMWNLINPDIAVLGNHEFDKGSQLLKDIFLTKVTFPIVDANVDMTKDITLKAIEPAPYKILIVGDQKVGVIGATTTETPYISSPGKNVVFNDPLVPVQKAADALTKANVNKIILVSHLGYDEDLKLASAVKGVDVIVGGHSHTLLGSWNQIGLSSLGKYPTELKTAAGETILVVQAWEWGKVVGDLNVDFDSAGKVVGYKANPYLVAGSNFIQVYDIPDASGNLSRVRWQWSGFGLQTTVYDGKTWNNAPGDSLSYWASMYEKITSAIENHPEIKMIAGDPVAWKLARSYALGVQEFQRTTVATVGEDLNRSFNAGPGPIIADSMRIYTGTQIGLTNIGGVRTNLLAGPLTTAQVYEVIPFGNTLVTLSATGKQVLDILEDGIDFGLGKYGDFPANPLLYISGLKISVKPSNPKGSRIVDAKLINTDSSTVALDPKASYTMVVNNFIAAGGDKYTTLASIEGKKDTGYIDAEAFFSYVKDKTLVNDPARITIVK